MPPIGSIILDWTKIDTYRVKVLFSTYDFPLFTRKAQRIEVGASLGFTDQLKDDFSIIIVTTDSPIGNVVADNLGEFESESIRKLKVKEDFRVKLKSVQEEAFLDARFGLDLVIETLIVCLYEAFWLKGLSGFEKFVQIVRLFPPNENKFNSVRDVVSQSIRNDFTELSDETFGISK